jgi:transcription termination/antitermination protein NusA
MNGPEVLRIVDAIHRDKKIDEAIVFEGIEQAILSAARKHYGEDSALIVNIDRKTGQVTATNDGAPIPEDELIDLGRIAAQTAKQVMIQKIREAERDTLFDEYTERRTQLITGTVTRVDQSVTTVTFDKVEALLPRSEQIPGESHKVGDRVRAIILEVRKQGTRIKVVLSRKHADLVRRLFEVEIPEVTERIIEVRSLSREAGYRSKVAVSCFDNSIDPVGACVGVRGSRIKTIIEELDGERIDIVRWNDSLPVLIPNALQPAEVEDVIMCPMLGKVIVLVREDQLSLAIGKMGQNVRLASKLVGWDIDVMTREELDQQLDSSVKAFATIPNLTEDLSESLVSQGFFSFEDLSVIEPDHLQELSGLSEAECEAIVAQAEIEAEREEQEAKVRKAADKADRDANGKPGDKKTSARRTIPATAPVAAAVETTDGEVSPEGVPVDEPSATGDVPADVPQAEAPGESAAAEG